MLTFVIVQDHVNSLKNDARKNVTQHMRFFPISQVRNPLKIYNISPETADGIQ